MGALDYSNLAGEGSSVSVIELSPPSQAFVDNRTTNIGPWVIGAFMDCILMGIVLCQLRHFVQVRQLFKHRQRRFYNTCFVVPAAILSALKTMQGIGAVWQLGVAQYANPDVARTFITHAWWEVSTPVTTAIVGFLVQSYYAARYFRLTRNWPVVLLIAAAMIMSVIGSGISTYHIIQDHTKQKVMWLMIHLICVFIADSVITLGTVHALYTRTTGQPDSLIQRLLRMVFEAAIPPAFIAASDLILTQTLGSQLLWHLIPNYILHKTYVISLLYTINSIGDYTSESFSDGRFTPGSRNTRGPRCDTELGGQVHVQREVTRHVSRDDPIEMQPKSGMAAQRPDYDYNFGWKYGTQ